MKKYLFFAIFLLFILSAGNVFGIDVPQLHSRVNDYAGMLNGDQIKQLEEKLESYETSTSNQIVVLTIPTLSGDNLEEFSMRVAEKWEIGRAKKDNGILLLIVKNDRKMRIEVGRGLEGVLPDIVCGRIINEILKPAFQAENYFIGINVGIDKIFLAIKGEFKAEPKNDKEGIFVFVFMITIIIIILIFGKKSGRGPSGSFRSSRSSSSGRSSSGSSFRGGGGRFSGGGSSSRW